MKSIFLAKKKKEEEEQDGKATRVSFSSYESS